MIATKDMTAGLFPLLIEGDTLEDCFPGFKNWHMYVAIL